jgi:hypothetical protein
LQIQSFVIFDGVSIDVAVLLRHLSVPSVHIQEQEADKVERSVERAFVWLETQ